MTLENISNGFYGIFLDQILVEELFDENEQDVRLAESGIEYSNIYLSLGIFGICLGFFIFLLLVYVVIYLVAERI